MTTKPLRIANDDATASTFDELVRKYIGEGTPPPGLRDRILAALEKPLIEQTLALTNGNQIRAADILGLNRNTLRAKIRALGVEVKRA